VFRNSAPFMWKLMLRASKATPQQQGKQVYLNWKYVQFRTTQAAGFQTNSNCSAFVSSQTNYNYIPHNQLPVSPM